jgi:protein-disulfide isomerase
MRDITTILAGALGGALLAVVVIFAAAGSGMLPMPQGSTLSDKAIHDYLMSHPGLVSEMTDKFQAQQQADSDKAAAAAMKKIGLAAFFDPKIAFVTGPAGAKKSVVEFYDYDCPYCRASLPAVEKFYQQHKNDTRFSFIEFPIPSQHGPGAVLAARASLAARNQPDKFVAFHFAMMSERAAIDDDTINADARKAGMDVARLRADMASPQIDKAINDSHDLTTKVGIDGTPTFIINGVMHAGAVDEAALADLAAKDS